MDYRITDGIEETALTDWLKRAAQQYGTFEDGRVNYTDADEAPIVMCTLVYAGKILLVKRGYGLADAEGYWSTINGFIDEPKPVKVQAQQEIKEELGLAVQLDDIQVGASYTLQNPQEKRRYIVFPCRITLTSKPVVKLDHEHTDFVWIHRSDLAGYEILDDLPYAIDAALAAA